MTEWKDYFGKPVQLGDEVIYAGKYGDLCEGTVDEMFGNLIVIKDSKTGMRTDFGWWKNEPFIKKSGITVNKD